MSVVLNNGMMTVSGQISDEQVFDALAELTREERSSATGYRIENAKALSNSGLQHFSTLLDRISSVSVSAFSSQEMRLGTGNWQRLSLKAWLGPQMLPGNLTELTLTQMHPRLMGDKELETIARYGTQLKSLFLWITPVAPADHLPKTTKVPALAQLTRLEKLRLTGFQRASVSECIEGAHEALSWFWCSWAAKPVSDADTLAICRKLTNLETLTLRGEKTMTSQSLFHLSTLASTISSLQLIDVNFSVPGRWGALSMITGLQTLKLSCCNIDAPTTELVFTALTELKEWKLEDCDEAATQRVQHFMDLRARSAKDT